MVNLDPVRWQNGLVTLAVLSSSLSCNQDKDDSVRVLVREKEDALYGYQMWAEPPEGVGWKFRFNPGRECGDKGKFSRPGLIVGTSRLDLGEYKIVERLEPRHFFSGRKLASAWMFGKTNPFSDVEDVSLRMTRGTVKVSAAQEGEGSSTDLPRPKAVEVELAGYIDPDWFRNVSCQFVSPKDGVIADAECTCINARGEEKTCNITGDESSIDLGRACCEQLNSETRKYVRIEASFTATYCSDVCSAGNPALLHRWCPEDEGE